LLIVLAVALLLFGHRLPSIGRALGLSITSFKQALKDGEAEEQAIQPSEPKVQPKALEYHPSTSPAPNNDTV
jgi:TatA/E family protein of Tat protein translocase